MIVYVETNFILELALEQDQHQAVDKILELVQSGKIELALPGFSISESLSTVRRKRIDRDRFYVSLEGLLDELKRSAQYQQLVIDLDPVRALLQDVLRTEKDRLLSVLERILKVGRVLELEVSSFSQALTYKDRLTTSTEDSIVYSLIITDLRRRPENEDKFFLSRDGEAFGKGEDGEESVYHQRNEKEKEAVAKKSIYYQRIKEELKLYKCTFINNFEHGLSAIEARLRKAG